MIDICSGRAQTCGRWFQFDRPSHAQSWINPLDYLAHQKIAAIHRFILSHPHKDHMGGIKALFEKYRPKTFWDTDNTRQRPLFGECEKFWQADWDFYATLHEQGNAQCSERLSLREGLRERCQGEAEGDGLHVLWPSQDGLDRANLAGDFNTLSSVILYRSAGHKILFTGDVPPWVWGPILSKHRNEVADIDILIAPHHGMMNCYSDELMQAANPVLTIIGRVNRTSNAFFTLYSKGYQWIPTTWQSALIFELRPRQLRVYATNGRLVEETSRNRQLDLRFDAYFLGLLTPKFFRLPTLDFWELRRLVSR